jgi:hypothetical protein
MPRYNKSLFGMYGGEEVKITLEAENEFAGVLIDRFGKDIIIRQVDAEHFRTVVNVAVSNQFFGWIMSLGNGVKIVAPESVVEQMRQVIRLLNETYKG